MPRPVMLKNLKFYEELYELYEAAFALLHSVLQGQIRLLLQISLDFLVLHFSPL